MMLSFLLLPMAAVAFVVPSTLHMSRRNNRMVMMAEGGPPQYTKRSASVVSNTEVGKGSFLISVETEEPVDYEPGHVLALEIQDPSDKEEWMKGPYTVTRSTEKSFDVLYKVVGKKTETYSAAQIGDKLQFGGKFKVPILEGLVDTDNLDRVVGLSTGVGIGPLIGFAEQALLNTELSYRIDLYVAFRESEDVCCKDTLDALVTAYPDRFSWTPVISSIDGHFSTIDNLKVIRKQDAPAAGATHYHMIGNGSMVNEWKAGLSEAGVPDTRVTLEMYFNHKEAPREDVVKQIAEVLKESSAMSMSAL